MFFDFLTERFFESAVAVNFERRFPLAVSGYFELTRKIAMTRVTKSQEAFDTLVKVHIATAELAKKQKELENLKEMVLKTDLEIENLVN